MVDSGTKSKNVKFLVQGDTLWFYRTGWTGTLTDRQPLLRGCYLNLLCGIIYGSRSIQSLFAEFGPSEGVPCTL